MKDINKSQNLKDIFVIFTNNKSKNVTWYDLFITVKVPKQIKNEFLTIKQVNNFFGYQGDKQIIILNDVKKINLKHYFYVNTDLVEMGSFVIES